MKLPIITKDKLGEPPRGFGYAFIDSEDKKLKIKKQDGVIEFNNDLNDIQLLNLTDYTAFEVFAHDYDIPVGECEELGGYVNNIIPAQMSHQFTIRSEQLPEQQNVIVDWGDGSVETLSNYAIDAISGSDGDRRYLVNHTYTNNGKYFIKIYGNSYFALIQASSNSTPNILSRALTLDLPVASHLRNFSSFCRHSLHLLNVDVYSCTNFNKNFTNISSMFTGCKNLLKAIGFSTSTKQNVPTTALFFSCTSLVTTNFSMIPINGSIKQVFRECTNLECDIEVLLSNFYNTPGVAINTNTTFYNCKKLYGTIPDKLLWNNKNVNWAPTKTFTGCSDELRAQVPESWGGTASDDIIEKSEAEKIVELESTIASLTERIAALENA